MPKIYYAPGYIINNNNELVKNYDPNQPRDPAGSSTGGQWSKDKSETSFNDKIKSWTDNNLEIAKKAPKTKAPDDLQGYIDSAFALGEKARKNGIKSTREAVRHDEYDKYFSKYDYPEFVAFEAGLLEKEKPYWVNGWRYGLIPKAGKSMNFAEGKLETGISMMALDNGLSTPDPSFEMFGGSRGNQDRIYVSGFLNTIHTGGDGEPLLMWAKQTGSVK